MGGRAMIKALKCLAGVLACVAFLGCEHAQRRTSMSEEKVVMEFDSLRQEQVAAGADGKIVPADITVEAKEDEGGKYSLVSVVPQDGTPNWFATEVPIPQVVFPNGAEWIEVEVWNDGTPIKIIADGADQNAECFEISFCHNDTEWTGWKTFRIPLRGNLSQSSNIDLGQEIQPPLRIKYMLILMRQGLPWQIGLRRMTLRLDSGS